MAEYNLIRPIPKPRNIGLKNLITFEFMRTPMPKQSARFVKENGKTKVYQPKTIKDYERNILIEALQQKPRGFKPLEGAIGASVIYYFSLPVRLRTKKNINRLKAGECIYKITKPDLSDNLNKPLFDALEPKIIKHDAQICSFSALKLYSSYDYIVLKLWNL